MIKLKEERNKYLFDFYCFFSLNSLNLKEKGRREKRRREEDKERREKEKIKSKQRRIRWRETLCPLFGQPMNFILEKERKRREEKKREKNKPSFFVWLDYTKKFQ